MTHPPPDDPLLALFARPRDTFAADLPQADRAGHPPPPPHLDELLEGGVAHGRAVLAALVGQVARQAHYRITPAERRALIRAFAVVTAAADLVGRHRALAYAERHRPEADGRDTFAARVYALHTPFGGLETIWKQSPGDRDTFAAASGLPLFRPIEALRYLLSLAPRLGVAPRRWLGAVERHAMTLARATELTVLTKVQTAVARNLEQTPEPAQPPPSPPGAPAPLRPPPGGWGHARLTGPEAVHRALTESGVADPDGSYCFLPWTRVEGSVQAASKARYDGPAVKVKTDDGRSLAVTVNHPVLTPAGWKRAGDLREGDDLVCYGSPVESLDANLLAAAPPDGRAVNDQQRPPRIDDVFEAISRQGSARLHVERPRSPLDFYGDAAFFPGQVSRVWADGELVGHRHADGGQLVDQGPLVARLPPAAGSAGVGGRLLHLACDRSPHAGLAADEWLEDSRAAIRRNGCPEPPHRCPLVSTLHTAGFQATQKRLGGDVQLASDLVHRLAGVVATHRVVGIERIRWAGHVYDLQTATGFIVSQGIITTNCEMVFRTNALDALNTGFDRQMADPDLQGLFPAWVYKTAGDDRVGKDHRPKDGKYFPASVTFAEARGPRVFNCLLPGTLVSGRATAALKVHYSGEVLDVAVAGGGRFSVTVNHPVLAKHGLVPAGQLQQGDQLVTCGEHVEPGPGGHVNDKPVLVEEVFQSLDAFADREACTRFDLYGDGQFVQGDIDVVRLHVPLRGGGAAGPAEVLDELPLVLADPAAVGGGHLKEPLSWRHAAPLGGLGLGLGSQHHAGLPQSHLHGPAVYAEPPGYRIDGFAAQVAPDDRSEPRQVGASQFARFGPAANLDAPLPQPSGDGISLYPQFLAELLRRFAGQVSLGKIVEIRRRHYSGPVYDLETPIGYFSMGWHGGAATLSANCRCTRVPITAERWARLAAAGARVQTTW